MRAYALILGALVVGCGSKIDTPAEGAGAPDTGTVADTGVADGVVTEDAPSEAAADASVKPTEDRTCKRLVDAYCSAATQACCTELGIPFAGAGCRSAAMAYCTALIDQVTLGRATYDDTQLEACAKSWEELW